MVCVLLPFLYISLISDDLYKMKFKHNKSLQNVMENMSAFQHKITPVKFQAILRDTWNVKIKTSITVMRESIYSLYFVL